MVLLISGDSLIIWLSINKKNQAYVLHNIYNRTLNPVKYLPNGK